MFFRKQKKPTPLPHEIIRECQGTLAHIDKILLTLNDDKTLDISDKLLEELEHLRKESYQVSAFTSYIRRRLQMRRDRGVKT